MKADEAKSDENDTSSESFLSFLSSLRGVGKREPERRALPEFALDGHRAAVGFHELLDDGEAEPHAARLVRVGL